MKGILLSILPLMMAVSIISGCDTGRDRAITGNYFNRNAGELHAASVRVDSLRNYPGRFSAISNAMAGKYGDAQAFAVIKFSAPSLVNMAGLESARLKIIVSGVWSGGIREFGLYPAGVDWSDSTQLDPGVYLDNLGSPLAVSVDSTEVISSLLFELNSAGLDYIRSWSTSGAFLIKNTDQGNSMMNIYTHYSNSQPLLEIIAHTTDGMDTTRTNPIDSAYAYDTGFNIAGEGKAGILSDGAASGFTLHVTLPDSFSQTWAFNSGKLVLPISHNQIPATESMNVGAYLLTAQFSRVSTAETSGSYYTEFTIGPADTKIELDISGMLGAWAADGASNYGILFKPIKIASTPAQIVLASPDSVGILFTTIPEVE